MDQVAIQNLLNGLVASHPHLMMVVTVIGVLRAIFKPLMTLLQAYADSTPTLVDDNMLNSFKSSNIYKGLSFVVDYLMSVKLPQAPPPPDQPKG